MIHVVNNFIDSINEVNYRVGGDSVVNADVILHNSKSCDEYYSKLNTWYNDQKMKIELMEKQNGSR